MIHPFRRGPHGDIRRIRLIKSKDRSGRGGEEARYEAIKAQD